MNQPGFLETSISIFVHQTPPDSNQTNVVNWREKVRVFKRVGVLDRNDLELLKSSESGGVDSVSEGFWVYIRKERVERGRFYNSFALSDESFQSALQHCCSGLLSLLSL